MSEPPPERAVETALSEALRPELTDPWIWIPTGLMAVVTEIYALRTGRSPATDIYRWTATCPGGRPL